MNKSKTNTGNSKPKQPASSTKSTKPKEAAKKSATTTTAKTTPKTASTSVKPTPVTNTTASAKKTPATKPKATTSTSVKPPPPATTGDTKNSTESATNENNTNVKVVSPPSSTEKVAVSVKATPAAPKSSAKKAPAATAKSKTAAAKTSATSVKTKPAPSTAKTSVTKTPAATAKTTAKAADKKRPATSVTSSVKPKSATTTTSKSGKSSANTSKSNSRQSSRQVSPSSTISDRSKVSHDTPDSHETPAGTPNDTPEDSVTRPRANTSTSLRELVTVFESTAQLIAASTQPPEKSPRRSSVKSSTLRQLSKKFERENEDSTDDLRKYLSLRHIKDLDASSELLRSPHVTENIPLLLWSNHVTAEHVVSNDHVLVTATSDEYVTVWDLLENNARQFSGHTSHVTGMALAAEGDQIVTLSEHEILSWRASDCHVTGQQQLRADLVALTSDGAHAVTAVNNELTLWTGEDLKSLKTISHGDQVTCLTMWPRSAGQLLFIVTGSRDRAIRLWDLATGECLTTIEEAHQGPITALRVLSQGRHVISYSSRDQHVKLWELDNKECVLQHHVTEPCTRTLIKVVSDWSHVTARESQWDDLLLATEIQNLKLQIGLSEGCCCILVSDEL